MPQDSTHLWQFTDDNASVRVTSPERLSRLYFPLANESGILSSISPNLHGDIKTSHNSFLTHPVTIEDLHNTKSSRNFWVYIKGKGAWSATGCSATQNADKFLRKDREKVVLETGMLWHKVVRTNDSLGLRSEITNFAPSSGEPVELMLVTLVNSGRQKMEIVPTSAIPIFARSADNLRDHHHVTSLLHRIMSHPAGVVVKPTMSFDERGHKINELLYTVVGVGGSGEMPVGHFSTVADFIGEGGNFEAPRSVIENLRPPDKNGFSYQGKPTIGAIRFKTQVLGPGEKTHFVLFLGIAKKESEINEWIKKFGSFQKVQTALKENQLFWSQKVSAVRFKTKRALFDGWSRWVGLQPTLRKIFGNSFLPDFDYGRGGRGWRDLWQDCLALLLFSPQDVRKLLVHNFNGVRIDGSNATIIGDGEFIADRNNITRVWMDHGVWPFLTLELYIHQSGDFEVLFENVRYFRDMQLSRALVKDPRWTEEYGKNLKDRRGHVVEATILEHVLVQHLVQFFNVGEHNHIRLEDADWNDGLDMARSRGESVAFTCFYAWNLSRLVDLLEHTFKKLSIKKVLLSKELLLLLDRVRAPKINYSSVEQKQKRLRKYFDSVEPQLSGRKIEVQIKKLIDDLRQKSNFIFEHIRQKEWLFTHANQGFFNGYYDNHGRRVEGEHQSGLRLTLAGQVFPVMSGIATPAQVSDIAKTVREHLKDREHGGYRLNTDFKEIRLDLGRAFSFAYGEKENGSFFSHMAVMYAYALFSRGFVQDGHDVLDSIFRMCVRTEKSKIYPGIPEYFNSEGRGMYHYLTGSASWYIFTMLTQVFGVRGHYGDLVLQPKFVKNYFETTTEISVETQFAGKRIEVTYRNPKKIPYEHYCIVKVAVNGKELEEVSLNKKEALISRDLFLKYAKKPLNAMVITLG